MDLGCEWEQELETLMESVDHHYHPHSVSFYRGANWHFQGGQPLSQGPSAEWALEPEILASHLMAFLPPHRLPLKAKGCDRNWQSFRHPASNHRCTSLPRTKQPELPKAGVCSGGHLLSPEPAHAQVHGQAVSEPQEWPHPCADLLCWPLTSPHSKWQMLLSGKTRTSDSRDKKRQEGSCSVSPLSDISPSWFSVFSPIPLPNQLSGKGKGMAVI